MQNKLKWNFWTIEVFQQPLLSQAHWHVYSDCDSTCDPDHKYFTKSIENTFQKLLSKAHFSSISFSLSNLHILADTSDLCWVLGTLIWVKHNPWPQGLSWEKPRNRQWQLDDKCCEREVQEERGAQSMDWLTQPAETWTTSQRERHLG